MEHFSLNTGRFHGSLSQMKKVSVLCVSAMLTALAVVLHLFTLHISDVIEISFLFVPIAVAGMMYGPVSGAMVAVAADVIKFMIRPTGPFNPGFTFSALLVGLVYGLSFYHRKVTVPRAICTQLILSVVVHIGLNSLWLSFIYHQAVLGMLPLRIFKTLIVFPVEVTLLCLAYKGVEKLQKRYPVGR